MIRRMKDIINLREAARCCRVIANASVGAPIANDYLKLAEEIDGKINSLEAADPTAGMPLARLSGDQHYA